MATNKLQGQIDETVGVMWQNVERVSQRGERLDSLQDKTDHLGISAQQFRGGANKVRKKMWRNYMKKRMCLVGGIAVLFIVMIVVPVVVTLLLRH